MVREEDGTRSTRHVGGATRCKKERKEERMKEERKEERPATAVPWLNNIWLWRAMPHNARCNLRASATRDSIVPT